MMLLEDSYIARVTQARVQWMSDQLSTERL
jgi:hypothetical protein